MDRQHHRETSEEKRLKIRCYASSNFQKTVKVRNRIFFLFRKTCHVKITWFLFQDVDISDLWLSYRQTLCVFPFLI